MICFTKPGLTSGLVHTVNVVNKMKLNKGEVVSVPN
jgi:hypothetical protein